jgi:hypothetical protein
MMSNKMAEETPEQTAAGLTPAVNFQDQVVCDTCGRFGVYLFDGRSLCCACYESCGSCCPEFGADESEG